MKNKNKKLTKNKNRRNKALNNRENNSRPHGHHNTPVKGDKCSPSNFYGGEYFYNVVYRVEDGQPIIDEVHPATVKVIEFDDGVEFLGGWESEALRNKFAKRQTSMFRSDLPREEVDKIWNEQGGLAVASMFMDYQAIRMGLI